MLLCCVGGLIGLGANQGQLDLKRGVAEDSRDLCFGLDLLGHEVEKEYLQGTDVLCDRSSLGHYKYIFVC